LTATVFEAPHLPTFAELMDLEEIDRDLYRGVNEVPENGRPNLYGGQIAAQALRAAGLTVPEGRHPHSLHGYFLRPGMRAKPVVFRVERDRDGRSFSARRVSALQDGAVILDLTASFHVDEPGGEYSVPMPEGLPGPDECRAEPFNANFPRAEARIVPPTTTDANGNEVSSTVWLRIREPLAPDRLTRSCALAYLSDIGTGFLSTDLPGLPKGGPSLDHAMWFRKPLRPDEWILHHMWPLHAGGARGLYAGSMFQHDGTLGVTITQESLLRGP
jgi:acyl-CoA thioesterase-2